MHLVYYQRGFFAEDGGEDVPAALGAAALGTPERRGAVPARALEGPAAAAVAEEAPPLPAPLLDADFPKKPVVQLPSGYYADIAQVPSDELSIAELESSCAQMRWRLEGGLREENNALESQVVQKQEAFVALQAQFKDTKDMHGERLAAVERSLAAQQAVTSAAERRVICTEDVVRFYEEQRRHMAGHWKAQCQVKDERIRYLNLQLTEYTIDWQRLGTQKQTEASLSHEFQCLKDRHAELKADCDRRAARKECLEAELAHSEAEQAELQAAAAAAAAAASPEADASMEVAAEASCVGLRGQLGLLRRWCQQEEQREAQPSDPRWPHSCIWRDELDVREEQLEKIGAQLDRMNNALKDAQAALAEQRARHEDMKSRHREAEGDLREAERSRAQRQRQCAELRRVESEIRFALEASGLHTAAAASPTSSAACGSSAVGSQPDAAALAGTGSAASSLRDRFASINRETQRLVALRYSQPPLPSAWPSLPGRGKDELPLSLAATNHARRLLEEAVTEEEEGKEQQEDAAREATA